MYDLSDGVEDEEFMESDEDEDNHSPAAHNWILPSKHLDELWDSLFFESDIKTRVLLDSFHNIIAFCSLASDFVTSFSSWNTFKVPCYSQNVV